MRKKYTGLFLGASCFMLLNMAICIISIALFIFTCDNVRDLKKSGLSVPTETILLVILLALIAIFCIFLAFVCTWFVFDKIKTDEKISLWLSPKCPKCSHPIVDDSATFCQNCGQSLISKNKTEKGEDK